MLLGAVAIDFVRVRPDDWDLGVAEELTGLSAGAHIQAAIYRPKGQLTLGEATVVFLAFPVREQILWVAGLVLTAASFA